MLNGAHIARQLVKGGSTEVQATYDMGVLMRKQPHHIGSTQPHVVQKYDAVSLPRISDLHLLIDSQKRSPQAVESNLGGVVESMGLECVSLPTLLL
jgi:hypothetical protein